MLLTKEQILNIKLPERTNSYTPISHGSFINEIEKQINHTNFEIRNTKFISNKQGTKVIGIYQLNSQLDNEIGPSIAFRNSYDKSMSAGLTLGSSVFICTNGMFTGDVTIFRKHTGTADNEMQQHIFKQINKMEEVFNNMQEFRNDLKDIILDTSEISYLVGELYFNQNAIKSTQLSIFKKEYYNPTINYNSEKNSAWDIYNKLTYAVESKSYPMDYINQHEKLYNEFHKLTQ